MIRIIYNILIVLLTPFILAKLLYRSLKSPLYRKRWNERFAFIHVSEKFQNGIWIHAVSVGETVAAAPLVKALLKKYPATPIIFTTMTVTGSARAQLLFGDAVFHVYLPYDFPFAIKRFIRKTKPKMLIIMETELWPNLIYYSNQNNIPILLANARLSEKSMNGYLKLPSFFKPMIRQINIISAQSALDADRFFQLGANKEQIVITGNIKFEVTLPETILADGKLIHRSLGDDRKILIAASTHENEEEIILNAFKLIKKRIANCLLMIAPRHPERFEQVYQLCQKNNFKTIRRSKNEICTENTDIYLGDTMGELMKLYAASDVAFVGGSLVPTGGHNILEPAELGLPILSGPHYFNFKDITKKMIEANAIKIVNNKNQLAESVIEFLENNALSNQFGKNAKQVIEQNKGALEKNIKIIENLK